MKEVAITLLLPVTCGVTTLLHHGECGRTKPMRAMQASRAVHCDPLLLFSRHAMPTSSTLPRTASACSPPTPPHPLRARSLCAQVRHARPGEVRGAPAVGPEEEGGAAAGGQGRGVPAGAAQAGGAGRAAHHRYSVGRGRRRQGGEGLGGGLTGVAAAAGWGAAGVAGLTEADALRDGYEVVCSFL